MTHPYRAKREQRERVKMTIQIFFQPLRLADTSPAVPRSIAEHGRGERDMHHSVPVIEGIIPSLLAVSRSITGDSALAI